MKKIDTPPDYRFVPVENHAVIEGVWSLTAGPGKDSIAPDTSCELIFHLAAPPEERTPAGWIRQPDMMLYGPLTRVLELRFDTPMQLCAVRLTPGGIGHLVRDPAALRNASHELADVLGKARTIHLASAAARGLEALAAMAAKELSARSGVYSGRLETALGLFSDQPGISAGELAAQMGVASKTLERTFLRQTGLRPGEFLRIHRFHAARRAIMENSARLAEIAAEHGYSDQAHMTREFRRLAGLTPRRKRSGEGSDVFYDN